MGARESKSGAKEAYVGILGFVGQNGKGRSRFGGGGCRGGWGLR